MNFDHVCPQCLTDSLPPHLHVYLLFICLITYLVQLVLPMFVGVGHPQGHGQPNRSLIIKEKLFLLRNHQLSTALHLGWGCSWAPFLSMLQCWLTHLILYWSYAGHPRCCEFTMSAAILSCPEDNVLLWFSSTSDSPNLLVPPLSMLVSES